MTGTTPFSVISPILFSPILFLLTLASGVLCKKVFLEISQNSQEKTCARVSFLIKLQACNLIKKATLAQVFSCEFCEISKNTFFTEPLWTTASFSIIILSTKKCYSSFLKIGFVFQKICFKVKGSKIFKFSSDCPRKTC